MIAVIGVILIMVSIYIGYKIGDEVGAFIGPVLVLIAMVVFKIYPYFS